MRTISEKQIEDVLQNKPDLIETGLSYVDRQISLGNRRIDLLFTDKDSQLLVVELKKGEIQRKDVGQIIEYMGYFLEQKEKRKLEHNIRTMLIGSKVPDQMKLSLNYFGVEWKEIDHEIVIKHLDVEPSLEKPSIIPHQIETMKKTIFQERVRTGNYKWALPLSKVGEQFKEIYPGLTSMSRLPKKGPNVKIMTDISHVHFEWYVRGPIYQKSLEVGLHIEHRTDIGWNSHMLEQLKQYRSQFDEIMGEPVFYGPHHDKGIPRKNANRISIERSFTNFDKKLVGWAVERMRKFYDFWNPIISDIK